MLRFLFAAIFSMLAAFGAAHAQDPYQPREPVRVIIGYPPGGGTDIVARIVLAHVQKSSGWTLVIENLPGATGVIGTRIAASAPPDGRTMLMGHTAPNAINPGDFMQPRRGVDWALDPVALVAQAPALLLARPDTGITDYVSFGAWARAQRPATYGSDGIGSQAHLLMHGLLRHLQAGAGAVHVPYKGGAPSMQAILAGDVPVAFLPAPVAIGHLKTGRVRVVAQTGASRLPALPNAPTLAQLGGPSLPALWWGLFAPSGTPRNIVAAWEDRIAAALADPSVRESLAQLGYTPAMMRAREFADMVAHEIDAYRQLSVGVE